MSSLIGGPALGVSTPPAGDDTAPRAWPDALKVRIHNLLVQRLNLKSVIAQSRAQVEPKVRKVIELILKEERVVLSPEAEAQFTKEILSEVFGLGPLEPLLEDPTVSDILVNSPSEVYVERAGRLFETDVRFVDAAHLKAIIDKIVSEVGRRIDESSPMVDARLPDGTRVHAMIPPLVIHGPVLSLRRFPKIPLTADTLVEMGTLSYGMLEVLKAVIRAGLNLLISGGTGVGKTTLLNALSEYIPEGERIITIEDTLELQLRQKHVVRLETRPANLEGKGRINQRDLLINALRMRPDRLIMGEVRGAEAVDMLAAMNTGHDGSLTTIHANGPRDALDRLEVMVATANLGIPERTIRKQIASAIQVVIQLERFADGTRKIVEVSEITGMEGDVLSMQPIFTFEREGLTEDRRVHGRFQAAGYRPKFADRLRKAGVRLEAGHFENKNWSAAPK